MISSIIFRLRVIWDLFVFYLDEFIFSLKMTKYMLSPSGVCLRDYLGKKINGENPVIIEAYEEEINQMIEELNSSEELSREDKEMIIYECLSRMLVEEDIH